MDFLPRIAAIIPTTNWLPKPGRRPMELRFFSEAAQNRGLGDGIGIGSALWCLKLYSRGWRAWLQAPGKEPGKEKE
ncbi:MAG TPA: hypothetical protein VLL04_05990 [Rhizomicrobium sp.]|nr:hypothetical protein [Rhizomicrobium sp.]